MFTFIFRGDFQPVGGVAALSSLLTRGHDASLWPVSLAAGRLRRLRRLVMYEFNEFPTPPPQPVGATFT